MDLENIKMGYKYFFWFLGLIAILYFLAKFVMPVIWHLVSLRLIIPLVQLFVLRHPGL